MKLKSAFLRTLAPANADVMLDALLAPQPVTRAPLEIAQPTIFTPWHLDKQPYETQGYKSSHPAHDWGLASDTPYYAPIAGKVAYGNASGYAYYVSVTNDELQMQVFIAHMPANAKSRVGLNNGDIVQAGQLIGYCDSTGNSTGPHCHLERRKLPYNGYRDCLDYRLTVWAGEPAPTEPPPEPPPPTDIEPGDAIRLLAGWYVRLGASETGEPLDITNQADTRITPVVARVSGRRIVFEVSVDQDGVTKV